MAQLTDFRFSADGRLMPLSEAETFIRQLFSCVVEAETVALSKAAGRVLAEPVVSGRAIPPFDNSAVDGYAVRFDDLFSSQLTSLPIVGRAAAGRPSAQVLQSGTAMRILTGAVLPGGADTVAMQEDCVVSGDEVLFPSGLPRTANTRRAGEDVAIGDTPLAAGRRLGPTEMAMLGALGRAEVLVRKPLRVALSSTGDEVAEPGEALRPGQIYDANRYMLGALLTARGAAVSDLGILPDDRDRVRSRLQEAVANHDLIITSGGVSIGEEDHVRAVVEEFGSLNFWRLAIRPGRPVMLGQAGGVPLLGLPGNPGAVLVTFALVARVVMDCLAGVAAAPLPRFVAEAGFESRKKPGRREFLRGILTRKGQTLRVAPHPKPGAGTISSLTESEVLIELPEDCQGVAMGDPVSVIPLSALYG